MPKTLKLPIPGSNKLGFNITKILFWSIVYLISHDLMIKEKLLLN